VGAVSVQKEQGKPGQEQARHAKDRVEEGERVGPNGQPLTREVAVDEKQGWAEDESDPVYGGTLSVIGKGAWAITCSVG